MKLVVHTFLTLDGVMQGPGGADEDPSNGFTRGGWLVPYVDQDFGEIVNSWFEKAEAILLGRTTYAMMSTYWSQVTDPDNLVAVKLNGLPKYIASTTLRDPEWHATTVLPDKLEDRVRELKQQSGGELQIHGSCGVAQTLHRAGLIDEYRLLVFPTTVGAGKRLFGEDAPPSGYTLVDSRVTSAGASYAALRPAQFQVGRVPDPVPAD
ncbi:MAG TPA: dihydrofolate reductase family protein [Pseudonocardiaceae bacterium]